MLDVQNILKKAADKIGMSRVRFKERNIPTSIDNVVIFPFFGDHRSSFVLSSILSIVLYWPLSRPQTRTCKSTSRGAESRWWSSDGGLPTASS